MRLRKAFSAEPASIRGARRFATEALRDADAEVRDAIALLVSELATNSIRHAASGFVVELRAGRRAVRVAVSDRGNGSQVPLAKSPSQREPSGRGLQIVGKLADEWGVRTRRAGGSTVWFTIRTAAPVRLAEAGSSIRSGTRSNATSRTQGSDPLAREKGVDVSLSLARATAVSSASARTSRLRADLRRLGDRGLLGPTLRTVSR